MTVLESIHLLSPHGGSFKESMKSKGFASYMLIAIQFCGVIEPLIQPANSTNKSGV